MSVPSHTPKNHVRQMVYRIRFKQTFKGNFASVLHLFPATLKCTRRSIYIIIQQFFEKKQFDWL